MAVEPGGIGARLRAGREKLGLTVLQVAERIHTDPKLVEAIEAENYEALGAPVYARGHIRHYTELVGESATELIGLYAERSKVAQPDLTRIVKAPSGSHTNKLVAPALAVIAVFAVAGAVWWVSSLSKKKPQLEQTHVVGEESPATASATPAPAQPLPQAPGVESPPVSSGPSEPAAPARPPAAMAMQPRPPAAAAPRTGAPAASTASTPNPRRSGGARAPAPVATAPAPTAAVPAPAAAAIPPRSRNQAQVTLRYSADSWTEVYDASGARLFYDVGGANSVQTVVGTPPLRVVLGNAAGVAVEFNGHNTPIAKLSHPDGSVQFSINRSGRVVRAKPGADGG